MAEHLNLYERARYYDVIFERDVSAEVDFIQAAYRHYVGRKGPASVLDIACGPGYHAREFARRGARAVGLDLRSEMLELGQEKAQDAGVEIEWLEADMRTFRLEEPVDAAFFMFDGLDALLTNEDLANHFRNMGENLTEKGIYLVDLTHPRDCSFAGYGDFNYRGRANGVEVSLDWATNAPEMDLVSGTAYVSARMTIQENGTTRVVEDSAVERFLLPQEIELLTMLAGNMRVAGWHGDYDLKQGLDNSPASRRMLGVLQKVG